MRQPQPPPVSVVAAGGCTQAIGAAEARACHGPRVEPARHCAQARWDRLQTGHQIALPRCRRN
jgi:hypothetical protein